MGIPGRWAAREAALMLALALLLLLVHAAFLVAGQESTVEPRIILDVGPNLGEAIPVRIRRYLSPWLAIEADAPTAAEVVTALLGGGQRRARKLLGLKTGERMLVLSLGDGAAFQALAARHSFNGTDPEGFGILALGGGEAGGKDQVAVLAGNGLPIAPQWNASTPVATGAAFAAYECLQRLGLAFWHPLEGPIRPTHLAWPTASTAGWEWAAPRWRARAFHLHTQHPLELTDVLQGFDLPLNLDRGRLDQAQQEDDDDAWAGLARARAGWVTQGLRVDGQEEAGEEGSCADAEVPGGDPCRALRAKGLHCELWEAMLPDVARFMEWSAAHRLNRAEWILLGNRRWGAIVDSPLRQARLALLARVGQAFGLMVGVDDPIAFQQQHSWVMTTTLGPVERQVAAVHARVDWLAVCGFDFLATESGLSEFSRPSCPLMLALLEAFAERANGTHGKEALVKVHCSTNQHCKALEDPRRPGEPLNFNFLPTYATPKLAVLPHTVQAYALDDPTAGVYGNDGFAAIHDYLRYEAKLGRREVHFYPETAYWVNVDIDVPLFLPAYAERRLHDLRLLAREERAQGFKLAGHLDFDSGWEWGYWLSDALMAAFMWDPERWEEGDEGEGQASCSSNTTLSYDEGLAVFERAVREHALRALAPEYRAPLAAWLAEVARFEHEVLLLGQVDGWPCPNQRKLSGIAYLIGKDAWVELPRFLGLSFTQPDYVAMHQHGDPDYPHVAPLLAAMRDGAARLYQTVAEIVADMERDSLGSGSEEQERGKGKGRRRGAVPATPPALLERVRELRDSMQLVALRARQVALLYEATSPALTSTSGDAQAQAQARRRGLLEEGRAVLAEATAVVRRREAQYQAPLGRVAGWRENPTVYPFDFLWTVHSLYYWWRDQGQAEGGSVLARWSPCYLNRMEPTEVAIGVGKNLLRVVRDAATFLMPWNHLWADCLAPPRHEFVFPRDL